MKHFSHSVTRNDSSRFIIKLPFKESKLQLLGDSRNAALKRFHYLERKLQGQPALREQYVQFMVEYIALGHMKRIDEEQFNNDTPRYNPALRGT